ncbi:glycosyltransferase family protein [Kordiimonas aestuarii]|uniref:hypothetical protein n=1 Tax=Kordiimonas aestuarii TaxID=1005925 RepID=UPI0021CEF312|nr:hypothetical protein [Kordiimonas aestuarii]
MQTLPPKPTLLFDPFREGHRLSHAEALLAEAENRPTQRFTLALHSDLVLRLRENPRWQKLEQASVKLVALDDEVAQSVKANNKDIAGGRRMIRLAEKLAQEHGCEHIHFLHLDTVVLALFFATFTGLEKTVSGMYMCPTEHYQKLFGARLSRGEKLFARVKKWVVSRLLSCARVTAIHVFDEFCPAFYAAHRNGWKIVAIPDFAPMPTTERRPDAADGWLSTPNRFAMFGAIDARKGIFPLLSALRLMKPELTTQVSIAFMGRVQAAIQDEFETQLASLRQTHPALSVTVIDRFVDDAEILWLCRNSTAIMMPYQRHRGSSGVLCWAAHVRVPVLAQAFGLVGREVDEHGLGITVDSESPAAIAAGLETLCAQPGKKLGPQGLAYGRRHTPDEFARQTLDHLCGARA